MKFFKTKVDTKGRISLPIEIRKMHDMQIGEKLSLLALNDRELTISPIALKTGNHSIYIIFNDFSSGFGKALQMFIKANVDILRSENVSTKKGTGWYSVLFLEKNNSDKLAKNLSKIKEISSVEIKKV